MREDNSYCNSYKYYENRECKYYPCHKSEDNDEHINCLFCYCPLYSFEHCPGDFKVLERNGKTIKSCMDCLFPHRPENYDIIIKLLASR